MASIVQYIKDRLGIGTPPPMTIERGASQITLKNFPLDMGHGLKADVISSLYGSVIKVVQPQSVPARRRLCQHITFSYKNKEQQELVTKAVTLMCEASSCRSEIPLHRLEVVAKQLDVLVREHLGQKPKPTPTLTPFKRIGEI